jgi:hypothetical protein
MNDLAAGGKPDLWHRRAAALSVGFLDGGDVPMHADRDTEHALVDRCSVTWPCWFTPVQGPSLGTQLTVATESRTDGLDLNGVGEWVDDRELTRRGDGPTRSE